MGKRRKRRKIKLRKPVRTLPKIFQCPNCGVKALTIELDKNTMKATVKCGSCKLHAELEVPTAFHEVDVYAKFLDLFYEGNLEYKFLEEEESEETKTSKSPQIPELES